MQEKRITQILIHYWEEICHGKEIPEMESFRPQDIIEIWPKCFIVSVHNQTDTSSTTKASYVYQYVGDDLTRIFGQDPTGHQVLPHVPHMPTAKLISDMELTLETPKPRIHESSFINNNGDLIKYRACLLPFGNDKTHITNFLAGLSWKAFKSDL